MKIALLGNPNTGKSSVFNMLTGLNQHVGNFPGVTVDKKSGHLNINGKDFELIDFPGTYSIYPRSKDEEVVYNNLIIKEAKNHPDIAIVVVDLSNLERNLLLFSQVYDLGLPIIMVLNMNDVAHKKGIKVDIEKLSNAYPNAKIVSTNARIKSGKNEILQLIEEISKNPQKTFNPSVFASIDDIQKQEEEATERFDYIRQLIDEVESHEEKKPIVSKWDKILVHPVWGYFIFTAILLIIFQFIYSFATIPMDYLELAFTGLSDWLVRVMPSGVFTDLLTQGIIPGIGGVVIFIPQIALLFFFIGILEESGYLARVVFIMDRLMRPLGLNGKSVVPLMSSIACAIPGVMAARTISDWKERLSTILIAPLMSCSARIPVYTLLIALVIPEQKVLGFINVQGLVLFGLYMLGTVTALLVALVLKLIIKSKKKGYLLLELPEYKMPRWRNIGISMLDKVKIFVWDAGKIILAISIILWALASYGPGDSIEKGAETAISKAKTLNLNEEDTDQLVASSKLENSYIGYFGRGIEPVIEPLGYDWKIGISLITSFAAREVFVGSMATIYAVHDDGENQMPLRQKMKAAKRNDGTPVYTLATGVSLMVFYAFAMMCMATLAVVKRETKSWKWPIVQLVYMGVLAYIGAYLAYNILS